MAAPYVDTSALTSLVKTAYDRKLRFQLRSKPTFRTMADSTFSPDTNPGSTITAYEYADMGVATTPLNEITDPTGSTIADPTPISVTVNEYGDFTVVTKKLQQFVMDTKLDSNVGQLLARSMNDTVDALVKAKLDGGTNCIVEIGGVLTPGDETQVVTGVLAGDTLESKHIAYAAAKKRSNSISGVKGDYYGSYIHPDVAHDLRTQSGAASWRDPHVYSDDTNAIWAAEIGLFESTFFMETPRCTIDANAGTGNVDVYNTYVFGAEALAEVVVDEFSSVVGGVIVDPLNRKSALGWKGTAGWSLYRPKALTVIKTSSSIGDNA